LATVGLGEITDASGTTHRFAFDVFLFVGDAASLVGSCPVSLEGGH
jgi:hypothetical protein